MEYNTNLNFTRWNDKRLTATFGKDADTLSCSRKVVEAVAEGRKVDAHPMLLPTQTAAKAAMAALNLTHA